MSKLHKTIVYLTKSHSTREETRKVRYIIRDIQGQLSLKQSAKVVTDCTIGNIKSYTFIRLGDESEQLHVMTTLHINVLKLKMSMTLIRLIRWELGYQ
ncbi:hypothetical protein R3W88_022742 [Solanum pinnatisectum]|uniref:Uncharacterized protein n=1 Tax=Solanum pinnatisectum TaxID=50273 RepID=A0AAV9LYV4_9SOLN|nr:hypothetical protein R3W88_022742 [Solanum pinnatisectum]